MSPPASFCVIRKFKQGDQVFIEKIITQSIMEQVGTFFWEAVFSEILIQICVTMIGISFVLIGIPFKFCIFAIPVSVVALYIIIWTGHWLKAYELSNDIYNISNNYMSDQKTCFFVAEVYGRSGEAEILSLLNKVKKVEYNFYNEKDVEVQNLNIAGLSKTVVGSIAITHSMRNVNRAWIRRMAVKTEYRRRQIGKYLLLEGVKFCEDKKFDGIELVTTKCHREARSLYSQEGFTVINKSYKSYYGFGANQDLFYMYRPINKERSKDDAPINETVDA